MVQLQPGGDVMRKIAFLSLGALFALLIPANAQDPGAPDSIVFGSASLPYTPGQWSYVNLPAYFVTDDSVVSFFLPISWQSADRMINPTQVTWLDAFLLWDGVYATVNEQSSSIRALGFNDLDADGAEAALHTNSQRVQVLTIRFGIAPDAVEQICVIDTTRIAGLFRTNFVLPGGTTDFVPVVVPGTITLGDGTGIYADEARLPSEFALHENYPNPFNPETMIEYAVASPRHVTIEVYNVLGQKVRTLISKPQARGFYQIHWNGRSENGVEVPSGVYFYRMTSGSFVQTEKMLLLK